MNIIDPHIHLFNLSKGNYDWLKPCNEPLWPDKNVINKSFDEKDIVLSKPLNLAGFVHIEAGFDNQQPWREIQWLESHCSLPFRCIAFIDITLATKEFDHQLSKLSQYKSVVGCRYILDAQADRLLKHHQVIRNLEVLKELDWLFELHVSLNDLNTLHHIVNFCTEIYTPRMVVNHAGFPPKIRDIDAWHTWRHHIEQLAQFDHLAIKCSGWEMTDRQYDFNWVSASVNQVIKHFGTKRTMLAGNFPLTLFNQSYQSLWQGYTQQINLSNEALDDVCYQTAKNWYQLPL
ncbi:amidohydrolase family protein [Thalassotalea atypica]|uniref:amidohydrolase family protein n=1 Tax=Thalassotalea atypica TaxID=2054316 RepID=UPI002573EFBF|nr:amidohydrolase family protein [Thalassotalea atypica]